MKTGKELLAKAMKSKIVSKRPGRTSKVNVPKGQKNKKV